MYDAVKYWSNRKKPNQANIDIDTPTHLSFLQKHLKNCCSILDFGPGIGRLFSAYKNVDFVEAYDITDQHKNKLTKICMDLGIQFNLTVANEIKRLPYFDKMFDVTVTTEVLLHQKPADIEFKWQN